MKKWLPQSTDREPDRQAAPTAGPDMSDVPDIEGIDVRAALERLGVPWSAFRIMLIEYRKSQQDIMEQLHDAVAENDTEAVRLHAHSMAGAGGNVSADDVMRAARELESAAGEERTEEFPHLLDHLDQAVSRVLSSLSTLSEPEQRIFSEGRLDEGLLKQLRRLKGYLDEFDPVGVSATLEFIREQGTPPEMADGLEQLEALANDLKYQEAREILAKILDTQVDHQPQ